MNISVELVNLIDAEVTKKTNRHGHEDFMDRVSMALNFSSY
jgi:hypothetical protein